MEFHPLWHNLDTIIFGSKVNKMINMQKGNIYFLEDGSIYLQDSINIFIIKEITDPIEKLELLQYLF